MRLALAIVLVAAPALAEEIKVELRHGAASARVGFAAALSQGPEGAAVRPQVTLALTARGAELFLGGAPVRAPLVARPGARLLELDGHQLPGRLEVWAEQGGLVVVNALDLEDYVAAVVSSEMPAGWPDAALQAQAVAARTYAVAQKIALGPGARAHLGATVLDQVYAGELSPGARRAADSTRGEVVTHQSAPIQAFFSSSCGGAGESGEAAFEQPVGSFPYLPGGSDGDADQGSPRLRWRVQKSLGELSEVLRRTGRIHAPLVALEVEGRTQSGRARTVLLRTVKSAIRIPAGELRALIGFRELPSTLFELREADGAVVFEGRGSGHGAGLCQWGARGRAQRGEGYKQILEHYYPGTEVRRMY